MRFGFGSGWVGGADDIECAFDGGQAGEDAGGLEKLVGIAQRGVVFEYFFVGVAGEREGVVDEIVIGAGGGNAHAGEIPWGCGVGFVN